MEDRKDIELKKNIAQFRKDSRIKECFHFDKEKCANRIISAHSIQNNRVLNLIEDEVNNNSIVYSLLNRTYDNNGSPNGFEPLGRKAASTFFGFCGFHDQNVFKPIEHNSVDLENDQHCFLLSYRAFAKDYHAKKETIQGYTTSQFYQKKENKFFKENIVAGSKIGLRDCSIVKKRMNEILRIENFDELDYFTYKLDYMVPIALAASFNPEYSYKNKILNKSTDPEVIYEFVNFVIQPTDIGETLILFSCLPEHKKSVQFLDDLADLKPLKLEKSLDYLAGNNSVMVTDQNIGTRGSLQLPVCPMMNNPRFSK
ncbi:hypothetical protein LB467_17935 [Salegentibacter sp. JZCK2]|uniref:hypothetical protein n=1 Tax=Salegentibacter tibetensis TaxID=2873600 RepID=UPI001CCF0A40|nr:hypothetical protein [Salegentibacter tibetensis]MBZ9731570.1 hypothetical protein [Salegentibacter tibetensis]